MANDVSPVVAHAPAAFAGGAIVFALAGARYAVPVEMVEGIAAPPALCRVPHATQGLLGAGNVGGQVLPIVDCAALVQGDVPTRAYDGRGEVLRVRAAGGDVGLWIDHVERLVTGGTVTAEAVEAIDPELLVGFGVAVPRCADETRHPLGDVRDIAERTAATAEAVFIVVEAAGERVRLPYDLVLELVEPPPAVALPGAPDGFRGIGVLRGEAVPLLSLASLLGSRESEPPAMYAVIDLAGGHRVLLGCDRVLGLRSGEEGRLVDPRAAIPKNLRRIVTSFTPASTEATGAEVSAGAPYLSFIAGQQAYALPVEAVERAVLPQRLVTLPQLPGAPGAIAGAIELKGQVVPLARLDVDRSAAAEPSRIYIVLRGETGLMALGAERIERLVSLRPEQIAAPPGDAGGSIDGVALLDGGAVLRILAPDRIGSTN